MEYTVFDGTRPFGSASAEKNGLYWDIRASCSRIRGGVIRLYAAEGEKCVNLGVLLPEQQSMALHKRIAAKEFAFTEHTEISTAEPVQLRPFSGQILDLAVEGAALREENGNRTILIPVEPEKEFPLMPLCCFFRIESFHGRRWWMLDLDAENRPLGMKPAENGWKSSELPLTTE